MSAPFYDCHTHLFPADRLGGLMRWIHRAVLDFKVPLDITAEQAASDLRRAGAVRWANLLFPIGPEEAEGLHAWGLQLAGQFPEMVTFGGVHINDEDPLTIVEEAVDKYGVAGFKFHPMVQQFNPWDNGLRRVLSYLDARGLPVVIHTGYDESYGHDFDRNGFEQMLETYPSMPVVLAHSAFPDIDWAFALADRFPQVWLDLTNVPGSLVAMEDGEALLEQFHIGLVKHRDRVLMGTDYPAGMGTIHEIVDLFHSIGIERDLLDYVMTTSTKGYFDRYGQPES